MNKKEEGNQLRSNVRNLDLDRESILYFYIEKIENFRSLET